MPEGFSSNAPDTSRLLEQIGELRQQLTSVAQRVERIEGRLSPGGAAPPAPFAASANPSQAVVLPPVKPPVTSLPSVPSSPEERSQRGLMERISQVAATSADTGLTSTAPTTRVDETDVHQTTAPHHVATGGATAASAATESGAVAEAESNAAARSRDWENLVGGKWALWVGSACLFLAMASFLAYTWKSLPPPPPAVRVAMGIAAGAAFLGAGGFFRLRVQHWFSEGLMGTGLGVLYLSIWAGAQYFDIVPVNIALIGMSLTTALGVFLGVRFDAVGLSALAVVGGFATPVVLHAGGSGAQVPQQAFNFLTYIAVLDAGVLAVSLFKRWRGIVWLSLISTVVLLGAWSLDSYSDALRWPAFTFFTLYFLEFFGAACFYSLIRKEQTAQEDLLLLFSVAALYSLVGYALVEPVSTLFPASFPLALCCFFALAATFARASSSQNRTLRLSLGGLSLLCLTVAVPIQLRQHWVAIGWSLEAAMLLVLAHRLRADLLLRAGQIVWGLSIFSLLTTLLQSSASRVPLLNDHAISLLASVLAASLVAWIAFGTQSDDDLASTRDNTATGFADELTGTYAAYAVLGGAWFIAQETHAAWSLRQLPTAEGWQAAALYSICCLWSVYALALFTLGIRSRHNALRLTTLAVAAGAVVLPVWASIALPTAQWTPFLNLRWGTYFVVACTLFVMIRSIARAQRDLPLSEFESMDVMPSALSLFVLAGITLETFFSFAHGAATNPMWRTTAFFFIAMMWSGYATFMLFVADVWRQPTLRVLALCVGALGVTALLSTSLGLFDVQYIADVTSTPVGNLRFTAFIVVVAMLGTSVVMLRGLVHRGAEDESAHADTIQSVALLAAGVLLWGLTQETYEICRYFRAALGTHWTLVAYFSISILWHLAATAFFIFGLFRQKTLFGHAARAIGAVASTLLVVASFSAVQLNWAPLFNVRFVAFVAATMLLWVCARSVQQRQDADVFWYELVAPALLLGPALMLWGLTQEAYETCYYFRQVLGTHWDRWAQMSISLVWSVYGASLLISGIKNARQPVRVASLGLLAVTVGKVFLFDLSFLDAALRILSLGGLGAALLFISWLYSRFGSMDTNDLSGESGQAASE
jgi:uncharacterized membrane protein